MNKRNVIVVIGAVLVLVCVIAFMQPAATSVGAQAFYYTPTALPDGRIMYVVKSGDTCISIALMNGLDEGTLRTLNNLQGDDCLTIQAGQQLLLGTVDIGPTATVTPTPGGPTPTPFSGYGSVCILLFNDINGDGFKDELESTIAEGAISVADRVGLVSLTGTSIKELDEFGDWKSTCFEDIPEGEYNISVAIPEGYNPTTNMNYALTVSAGDTAYLDFGAQPGSGMNPDIPVTTTKSPLLLILGSIMVLGGVGMGAYFFLSKKRR